MVKCDTTEANRAGGLNRSTQPTGKAQPGENQDQKAIRAHRAVTCGSGRAAGGSGRRPVPTFMCLKEISPSFWKSINWVQDA